MKRPRASAATLMATLLTLGACSGQGRTAGSAPPVAAASPTGSTQTGSTQTGSTQTGSTSAPVAPTTSRPRASSATPSDWTSPRRTVDTLEQRVSALRTEGGVASLVLRLPGSGHPPAAVSADLAVGQTLRLVVLSPVRTHLTGRGLGVDADVPAGSPIDLDVVAFAAGDYVITGPDGTIMARIRSRG